MTSPEELLLVLRSKGVELWLENGRLRYRAPKGALSGDDIADIRAQKDRVIELLTAMQLSERDSRSIEISRPEALPLSFVQQRLWFIDQLEGGSTAYHIAGAVRLLGELDRGALQTALDTLIDRHEILRTVFSKVDGSPVQVIAQDARFALQSSDLSDQPVEERESEVTRQASEEAQGRFDLSVGPLIRGRLIRLSDEEHVLLVTMHHIVSDGWSMGILVREVAALYGAYREGRANPLTTLPIQYADYAVWQRAWLQGAVLEDQLRYWTEHLSGAPTLLALPTDRLRPAVQSYRGTSVDFVLSAELSEQLKRLSRQHDATLFMTLYTAFAILLSRLSGQTDVVIGTSVANRQRTEVEGLIGFFVNTLALRAQLRDDPTVSALLSQVKGTTLGAYGHQELPFEKVVEAIQPVRTLSHNPIIQAMLVLQNTPQSEIALPGLTLASQSIPNTTAQFDFTLSMQEAEGRLVGSINYASDLFDRVTIERWSEYFNLVLTAMVADCEQRVSAIELLSKPERDQLLHEFNATDVAYPQDHLIHELFEAQVARTPDAMAVVYAGEQLSYRELNQKANQVAQYLRSQGVGPDQLVAICVERSAEMVIALLGVLKSGSAYVPIDPSYPADRVAYMLADAAPRVVLTQARLRHLLQVHGATVIALDEQWSEIAHHSDHTLIASDVGVTDRHLAYVIYTSGSTGKPKGVMVEQSGLRNYLQWALANYAAEGSAGTVVTSSFAFDATVTSLYTPLLSGGVVTLVKEGEELEGLEAVLQGSKEWSFLKISPAHLQVLGQRLEQQGLKSRIRAMVIGGEALSPATVRLWQSLSPATRLINEYGPTETVVGCSVYEVPGGWGLESVPIGRPIANTQIYILDPQRQPVPLGVVGEIYIGGAGVARGYLNREDLTAERFIPDPFSNRPNARLYKSGDLGRYRADGTIEYLGRNDSQVKIRGFRIELGEIESQLTKHPGIQEAVVLAREDVPGEKRLVAYLTHTEAAPSIDELRTQLQAHLPEYMVPSAYVLLDHFPLTPNGKLDRNALPAPELTAYSLKQYEAPQGEIEQALASIWQELLQVERVGRHDNFFELGGHSLLIVQLIDRLRSTGLHAEVRDVFSAPTLSALASTVGATAPPQVSVPPNLIPSGCEAITPEMLPLIALSQAEIDRIVQTVPGGASNVQDIYPLAPLQEGLLFHHLLNEHSDTYILPSLMVANSRTQLDALLSAIQAVIDRHDILRTAILWKDLPRSVQVVYRRAPLRIEERELDPSQDTAEQFKAWMAPGQLRMDLQCAPLIRVEIAQDKTSERWYALLYYHHIISDHVALEIIQAEVQAHLTGESVALPAPLAYRGYVAQALAQAQQNDAAGFFRAKLGTVSEPTAPFGLLDVHGDGSEIDEVRRGVAPEVAQRIRSSARRMNVSAATLFHAAYALVIAKTSGRDDVVFGSVLLGRMQGAEGVDRVLGMFMNTLPVRVQLQDINARQLIEQMQRELVELVKYEQASLAEAQRCSGIGGQAPLFSALLNYRHNAPANVDQGAVSGPQVVASYGRTNYPFTVSVDDFGDGFGIAAQTDRRIDANRVTGYVQRAIESLVTALESHPDTPALQLSILPQSERQQLLRDFNATASEYPPDQLIHELFAEQVKRTPQAIAVSAEGNEHTYEALNRRANQLAHYLKRQGVGPDGLVAVYMERSVEMVVALLGVLKAGGAYMPLDPNYPAERLEYMVADAAPRVVLTQERLRSDLPVQRATVIALDKGWSEIEQESDRDLSAGEVGVTSRHLAYVIYTSGSTGQPKGVMNEHGGLVNRLLWMQDAYRLTVEDRVLQKTPFSFDVSVWEFFWTLLNGARLVMARPQGHQDPGYLRDVIQTAEITTVHFVPSMLQVFLEQGGVEQCRTLRQVVCSGEELSVKVQNRCLERFPQVRLHNLYGPTEAAIDVTYWECGDRSLSRVPIGRPISNTQIYLLDSRLELVPLGVVGEIYIGGAGVARGYLNRPELTAERFIPDPFNSTAGARLYKSGDLGRYRADGTIEYLGRNDSQVKIRGFRIELGEIESQLTKQAGIHEAVVIAREDVPGEKRLVAYLTHAEVAPSIEALRTHLHTSLPEYMVPSAYVLLERIPLTPNGKVDRQALPVPELGAYSLKQYEAPQGETEQTLAGIWQELLQVERVGRQDNFFELGGHSLLIVQLIDRLRSTGLHAEVRDVFNAPTLSALASTVGAEAPQAFSVPPNLIPSGCEAITPAMLPLIELSQAEIDRIVQTVPGGASNVQDIYPLAPLQEGLLFHHLLNEQGDTYILPTLMVAESRAQLDALLSAIQAVIDRHDILRTAIVWQELPRAVQVVHRRAPVWVQELTLDTSEETVSQLKRRMAPGELRIDLQRAPLIRVEIAQDKTSERWFALRYYHHIISDHVALEIIQAEVRAHLTGQSSELPAPLAYRGYVAQALAQAQTNDAARFFRTKLGTVVEPTAPFGLLNVHGDGTENEEVRREVDSALAQRIRHSARRMNVSAATLFHAAYALVIAHTSSRDDVVFGSVLLGRLHGTAGVQHMLGMFINTLPVRVQLKDTAARQLIEQMQSELVELVKYEQASLAEAQRCSGIGGQAPLFSALLNYRHNAPAPAGTGAESGIEVLGGHERTNYPFTVSVDDFGEGFGITAQTNRRIDADRVTAYVHRAIESLVTALESHPDTPALQLSILPERERDQLLSEFNATDVAYPQDHLIHELFEEQVEKSPDAIAVCFEGQQLTYRELNGKANQLARHLRTRGVGPDQLVAICVERSVEMVVGLLGVLKAGGAYVPVDPSYPAERVAYMLADAAPRVVLTQARLRDAAPVQGATVITLDEGWSEIAQESDRDLSAADVGVTSRHLAYVIYTSGSTGQPKGVMVTQGNGVNFLKSMQARPGIAATDRVLAVTTLSFDIAGLEIYLPLTSGAQVIVAGREAAADPMQLMGLLEQHAISLVQATPATWRMLLSAGWAGRPTLKVLCGGEALSGELARQLGSRVAELWNLYGPTETTIWSCCREVTATASARAIEAIGRPIANTQIYILDSQRQPVPLGVIGEIYIGGAGVARGYLNRPELTAERFIPDPFNHTAGARLYKSGDLGRFWADGTIEYLGRNDSQVKIRGFRIELGEIESLLNRCEGVNEAVVLAREEVAGEKRLVAYLTYDGIAPSGDELRTHLRANLPEYMIPSAFVQLGSWPLTPNGKLDRKALPTPELDAYATKQYEEPQGAIEATMATIWQELLQVERVGRHDNFFELGGHSLLAVRLASRVRQELDSELSLQAIFESPTLAALTERVENNYWAREEIPLDAVEGREVIDL